MDTIPFDRLKSSGRSQASGFSSGQAKGLAENLAAPGAGRLVSKSDMERASAPVGADLGLAKYGVAALTALNTAILVKSLVSRAASP